MLKCYFSALVSYPVTISMAMPDSTAKWGVGVRQYPSFAEYHEGVAADGTSGVSDTGITMRAFLPITGQENRTFIHRYEGMSRVFDTRVVCVRPNITDLKVNGSYSSSGPILSGNMAIPSDLEDTAAASHLYVYDGSKFSCQFPTAVWRESSRYHPSDWTMTICQFTNLAGYIQPSLSGEGNGKYVQRSYLLTNLSDRSIPESNPNSLPNSGPDASYLGQMFNDSIPGLMRRNSNDWVDLYRANDDQTPEELGTRLSFSLCFTAFRAVSFNISASSLVPLKEPRYWYDPESGRLNFDDVKRQMLTSSGSFQDRGVLSMATDDWSKPWEEWNDESSYFDYTDVDNVLKVDGGSGPDTLNLVNSITSSSVRADVSIGGLLLDILRSNGTTAEAVQSMLMVALESRYQDYLFSEFKGNNKTSYQTNFTAMRAEFIAVQSPARQGHRADLAAGATLSYVIIMVTVFFHSLMVSIIIAWYLKGMSFLSSFKQELK